MPSPGGRVLPVILARSQEACQSACETDPFTGSRPLRPESGSAVHPFPFAGILAETLHRKIIFLRLRKGHVQRDY
jgi:hypothetical protein